MPTGLLLVAAFLILGLTAGVCIIHLIRNTFRLTSRKYWDELKRDIKPIYTAVNATAARRPLNMGVLGAFGPGVDGAVAAGGVGGCGLL